MRKVNSKEQARQRPFHTGFELRIAFNRIINSKHEQAREQAYGHMKCYKAVLLTSLRNPDPRLRAILAPDLRASTGIRMSPG